MRTLPFATWIANAAAGLTGPHGAITASAELHGCSRQSVYDHSQKVLDAVATEHSGGPSHEQLLQENEVLRRENAQLWDWLCQTIEFPLAKQQQYVITALAMGLSLNQTLVLLTLILGTAACPGRTTVHRWAQAAGTAAGRALQRLDRSCGTLVLVGCLDEIFFHRRPVLVGVEPQSMVWFLGQKADNHRGATWLSALRPWSGLHTVICDAGQGLQGGVAAWQRERTAARSEAVPLKKGLDVFHTKQEAHRVLKAQWHGLERLWEQAEDASGAVAHAKRQGRHAVSLAQTARAAWNKVAAAFRDYEEQEAAWKSAELALNLFRPDGELNDRSWAQAQVRMALPTLSGSAWSKVRRLLQAAEAFTFLDQVQEQLKDSGVPEPLSAALVRLWWLRRQGWRSRDEQSPGGPGVAARLVQTVLCQRIDPNWQKSYCLVARILSTAVRASSAVECMNSVLRMHQSRHRTLNQGMLDLKRLYWNTRQFLRGKRRGRCPYQHLGLKLPRYDFWSLLANELPIALGEAKEQAWAKRRAA